MIQEQAPLLQVRQLGKWFGRRPACQDIELAIWPGEVIAVVGESGSGKTTLLRCAAGLLPPSLGSVIYTQRGGQTIDLWSSPEALRRRLIRSDFGYVHQNPRDGVRMGVSAGANIGEPLMSLGARHYANIRASARDWLRRVEIDDDRIDDPPATFSGGMQQRLQIARNLVAGPRLLSMDEPTSGLDLSVQARLLDLLRQLVDTLSLAAIIVTHDLGVARLLAHRVLVMQRGRIVETGLADQVLDDPQHPYSQLLVASVLPV